MTGSSTSMLISEHLFILSGKEGKEKGRDESIGEEGKERRWEGMKV